MLRRYYLQLKLRYLQHRVNQINGIDMTRMTPQDVPRAVGLWLPRWLSRLTLWAAVREGKARRNADGTYHLLT